MAKKKTSSTKIQTKQTVDNAPLGDRNSEDEILNSIANVTVILMGLMMGAFTQVVVSATGLMASGVAEAMGGKEAGAKVEEGIKQNLPEVDKKMKAMISDIRKDIYNK